MVDAVQTGPGGEFVTVLMCMLPLIVLVVVTLIPNPWKSTVSLPFAAFMMFLIRLAYLGSDPINVCASVIAGALDTITPISIAAGAIVLFETMGHTNCMPWVMRELKLLSKGHPVAEIMLIGLAFAYLVEGASGFGTPAALATPMLAELGHPKMQAMAFSLLTNTLSTVFGAVGTPWWFGYSTLDLSPDLLQEAGKKCGITVAIVAVLIIPVMLNSLLSWRVIYQNILFIELSTLCTVGPCAVIGLFTYEFGTIIGGMTGIAGTLALIHFQIGLAPVQSEKAEKDAEAITAAESEMDVVKISNEMKTMDEDSTEGNKKNNDLAFSEQDSKVTETAVSVAPADSKLGPREQGTAYVKAALLRTFPIWCTVLLLILSRIEPIGLKGLLKARTPALKIYFKTFGIFELSPALVIQLHHILGDADVAWAYEALYTPATMPFLFVSLATMAIHRKDLDMNPLTLIKNCLVRLGSPCVSLMGAMMLVSLIRTGGNGSPAYLIGAIVSGWVGTGWIFFSTFIGCLGSFFSGSTTVSNLTFGKVQTVAAQNIGVSVTSILALQTAGAAMGNAVCMANIINAKAVLNLNHISEGAFIRLTAPPVLLYGLLAEAVCSIIWIAWGK